MPVRLFTGIRIPPELHERLSSLQSGAAGARWTRPENFHVTLNFIGDVEESRLEDLHDVLDAGNGPGFCLTLSGTGAFGTKAPKLIWAGLEPSRALADLQQKQAAALTRAGFVIKGRKFSPHVTLAYLSSSNKTSPPRLGPWFERTAPFLTAPFDVTGFCLIESRLGPGGSTYTDLHSYPLEPSPPTSDSLASD